MVTEAVYEGEKKLKCLIARGLNKKGNPDGSTSSNIDFINAILNQAYDSGAHYDVRDMKGAVQAFAQKASNQSLKCCKVVSNMHFCSKDVEEAEKNGGLDCYIDDEVDENDDNKPIVIYDIESFENFFCVGYKIYDPPGHEGEHKPHFSLFPDPNWCKKFFLENRLVGFNNTKYDDMMLYSAADGYSTLELYELSQNIVSGIKKPYVRGVSYADILDFSSEKKSLKKFELELEAKGVLIRHQEVGIRWDKPVPDEMFDKVAEYCMNDVLATEAVWNYSDSSPNRQEDWLARKILSEISGLPVGASNNSHSKVIMFGDNKNPQREFVYTDLSIEFPGYEFNEYGIDKERYIKDDKGKPIFTTGKSIYLGEDPSEGGFAWGKPGMYGNVKAFDVTSMHPSTMIRLNLFGDRYTKKLKDLVELRKALKRGDTEFVAAMFDGKLTKYLSDKKTAKGLSSALKIVINSIYGLTAAHFPNPFKDERNVDNIVAKRGALFMIHLKNLVKEKGYEVVHCKTDCIKVADADDYISKIIEEEGAKYGYEFEVEHWFDKLCILNKSTYIGRLRDSDGNLGEWIAVADQFKEPYVFKTLFSGEDVEFYNLCQTKSVKTAMYLDMNEDIGEFPAEKQKELEKLEKKIKKGEYTQFDIERYDELAKEEAGHHNYIFIGKVGSFVPIKPGYGGGVLVRDQEDMKYSVESTSGYRWLEAINVKGTELENHIDMSYYENMARQAVLDISQWGDFDWFTSDSKYDGVMRVPITADKAVIELEKDILDGQMNKPEE